MFPSAILGGAEVTGIDCAQSTGGFQVNAAMA